ncbi:MAG: hypothetical protein MJ180_04640 [Candidatus Gastranaerophilales bacterium]|nr:hypothetical protein [Candidatus Gastranaerophilales bacterium]
MAKKSTKLLVINSSIGKLIKDEIILNRAKIVNKAEALFHESQTKNIDTLINRLTVENKKLSTRKNLVLNRFKEALEEASTSKRQNVAINYNNGKLSATINDETISYNRSNSIFTFIKKVSDKILMPLQF